MIRDFEQHLEIVHHVTLADLRIDTKFNTKTRFEIKIDAFVSSPAKRAKKTAEIFMKEYKEKEKNLILVSSLYEASVKDFYDVVENLDDKFDTVALFSHNPGITGFINLLECSPIHNMPTCAVFALKIKTKHWKESCM